MFCMPCLVRLSYISFLNSTTTPVISSQSLWIIFWLAKASNKPISLTARLAINPLTCYLGEVRGHWWHTIRAGTGQAVPGGLSTVLLTCTRAHTRTHAHARTHTHTHSGRAAASHGSVPC